MKWKKFTLTTTTEAVDLISYTLDELGIEGIEIEDNIPLTEKETKGMFIDFVVLYLIFSQFTTMFLSCQPYF